MAASRRRPWESLSPEYRKKLQRGGIGKKEHAEGASLAVVRKYSPREAERKRAYRRVRRWAANQEKWYYRDADLVLMSLEGMDILEAEKYVAYQERMERRFSSGEVGEAGQMWADRPEDAPDWMFWYHGVFS